MLVHVRKMLILFTLPLFNASNRDAINLKRLCFLFPLIKSMRLDFHSQKFLSEIRVDVSKRKKKMFFFFGR